MILTVSSIKMFQRCHKEYELRHREEIVKSYDDTAETLRFGSLIHEALYSLYTKGHDAASNVIAMLSASPGDAAKANGMIDAYTVEEGQWVKEETFNLDLGNGLIFAGKTDGYTVTNNGLILLEHKTASQVDDNYLDALWTDFQIHAYAWALERIHGTMVSKVVYDVLVKPTIIQSKGETEAEYEARLEELIAKSKTGKSSAKQKIAETDEEYRERCAQWCRDKKAYHRFPIMLDRRFVEEAGQTIMQVANDIKFAEQNGFYKNTNSCMNYSRRCSYWQLCSSGGSQIIKDNEYKHEKPNKELAA